MPKQVLALLSAVAAIAVIGCAEKLEAGKTCPLLCPEQAITLQDTTIDAIIVDTTILGLPPIGGSTFMMLSSHGDTLQTRAIIRFDTLPSTFTFAGNDSTISVVDSAFLITPIARDSLRPPRGPITIEAYDVDTAATDTVSAIIGALFRADRFLGSMTYAPNALTDTLRIPINTDTVLARVLAGSRLRVGLRLVTAQGFDLQVGTVASGSPVTLQFKSSLDTAATPVNVVPVSNSPTEPSFLAATLTNFTVVLFGNTTTPATMIAVDGVPSRRTFLRFSLPSRIVDSTTIVRASLQLMQVPNHGVSLTDSVFVYPVAIIASPAVNDIPSQLGFLGPTGQLGLDSHLARAG